MKQTHLWKFVHSSLSLNIIQDVLPMSLLLCVCLFCPFGFVLFSYKLPSYSWSPPLVSSVLVGAGALWWRVAGPLTLPGQFPCPLGI
jgi:hypothetical protein